jgi:hypothetical protein
VDSDTGRQRLVYSDANAPFLLLPGGGLRGGIVSAGGRIFAEGMEPVRTAAGTPALGPGAPAAIYELSTDGSGQARKLFDVVGGEDGVNFSNLTFFNSSGTQFGSVNNVEGRFYLTVRDTTTGKLLRKSEFKYGSEERRGWRFGSVSRIGWMPDDKRIFFTIELAGDSPEAWWTAPSSPVGTYVLAENADSAERLAPEAALHPKIAGEERSSESPAVFIGMLPDGGYLLQDCQGDASGACLYELDLAKKTQKIFPFHLDSDRGSFHLSHSGNWLALTATQKTFKKQPKFSTMAAISVWVLDLDSGRQSKLISFPPRDETREVDGPWINLIGWLHDR